MRKEVVVAAVTTAAAVVAVAVLLKQSKRRSERRWRHAQRILRKFARDCATPVPKLWNVANGFVADMQAGLGSSKSNVSMFASYVSSLPTGDEKGLYYGITNSTPAVREVVAEVCDIVAERGARLAGAGMVGIIKKLDRSANKKSVVTVEGGLYEHYWLFRNYLHSSVWEMLENELSDNLIIQRSHGGSGAGVLFLAASQTENAAS
ncbi:hypothetical protein RJ639_040310 [Escallonia herrerae]|uniref:Phosphotransferase n=1 Tax=Escallonia herrerae TaxID=1293975 RepID=A0AA88WFC2_9ASTE|nr:hypothetical protein RJ639_040310 [Escallonia herrerae]